MSTSLDASSRRLAAVWFADIVGYDELAARDEPAAVARSERLASLAREIASAHTPAGS